MQYKPKITDNGVVLVEYLGMSPGWYPTYNDPDNSGCHPSAEPIYGQHLPTLPEHKDIWLSKEVWEYSQVFMYNGFATPLVPPKVVPVLTQAFADNGEFSHWRLVNSTNGELLWTEDPEEDSHIWAGNVPVATYPATPAPSERLG